MPPESESLKSASTNSEEGEDPQEFDLEEEIIRLAAEEEEKIEANAVASVPKKLDSLRDYGEDEEEDSEEDDEIGNNAEDDGEDNEEGDPDSEHAEEEDNEKEEDNEEEGSTMEEDNEDIEEDGPEIDLEPVFRGVRRGMGTEDGRAEAVKVVDILRTVAVFSRKEDPSFRKTADEWWRLEQIRRKREQDDLERFLGHSVEIYALEGRHDANPAYVAVLFHLPFPPTESSDAENSDAEGFRDRLSATLRMLRAAGCQQPYEDGKLDITYTHPHPHSVDQTSSDFPDTNAIPSQWVDDPPALVTMLELWANRLAAFRRTDHPSCVDVEFGAPNHRLFDEARQDEVNPTTKSGLHRKVSLTERAPRSFAYNPPRKVPVKCVYRVEDRMVGLQLDDPSRCIYGGDPTSEECLLGTAALDLWIADILAIIGSPQSAASKDTFTLLSHAVENKDKFLGEPDRHEVVVILNRLLKRERAESDELSLQEIASEGGWVFQAWVQGADTAYQALFEGVDGETSWTPPFGTTLLGRAKYVMYRRLVEWHRTRGPPGLLASDASGLCAACDEYGFPILGW